MTTNKKRCTLLLLVILSTIILAGCTDVDDSGYEESENEDEEASAVSKEKGNALSEDEQVSVEEISEGLDEISW